MPTTLDVAAGIDAILPEEDSKLQCRSSTDSLDTTGFFDTDEESIATGSSGDSFSDDTDEDTSQIRSTMIAFPRPGGAPLSSEGVSSGLLAPRARAAATCVKRYTTVMVTNLPLACMVETLLGLLDAKGYSDKIDFVYAPVNVSSMLGVGYAIVNLVSHEQAKQLMLDFDGFDDWPAPLSKKACAVRWSTCQGLDDNVARYQSSPILKHDVPASYKPALMKDGARRPLPEPPMAAASTARKSCLLRPRRPKAQ